MMWKQICMLALAGAVGTLCRYGLSGLVQRFAGGTFPWGTLAVNVVGCFLFGFVWMLAEERLVISGHTRFLILTGFMGALTTFSTFGFETGEFLRDAEWWQAGGNVLANNVLGVASVFLGLFCGRLI